MSSRVGVGIRVGDELAKRFCNLKTPEEAGQIIAAFFKLSSEDQVMFLSYVAGFIKGLKHRTQFEEEFK